MPIPEFGRDPNVRMSMRARYYDELCSRISKTNKSSAYGTTSLTYSLWASCSLYAVQSSSLLNVVTKQYWKPLPLRSSIGNPCPSPHPQVCWLLGPTQTNVSRNQLSNRSINLELNEYHVLNSLHALFGNTGVFHSYRVEVKHHSVRTTRCSQLSGDFIQCVEGFEKMAPWDDLLGTGVSHP